MRRSQSLLSIAFAATLVSGCLGSVGTPEPQTQTPTGGSGATAGGSGSAGGGGGGKGAGGGGGTKSTCAHSECTSGKKLSATCDACVTATCSLDSYCCSSTWDSVCISEAELACGLSCD
jgi:hypothetical protein